MSLNSFLMYLQQLLTMMNPKDEYSIALAKTALNATVSLAAASGKADPKTLRIMSIAESDFRMLVRYAEDFAGIPGQYLQNEQKRKSMGAFLDPHC